MPDYERIRAFAAHTGEGSDMTTGTGTKDDPWVLKTPPGTSEYTMYRDDAADPPVIVCQVGGTKLLYDARAIVDLHAMLKANGDWMTSEAPTSRSRRPTARSRHGVARRRTRWVAGTASR
jgi:hypothetical protein